MDIDINEIEDRIKGQFSCGRSMLFWEDEPGEYIELVDSLDLGEGTLVNVTGSELASKRAILRGGLSGNMVIYRAGPKPRPEDDFLYDVKLSSTPFSCKVEGVWASECGVPLELAGVLTDHARFFNSKERKVRLAGSALDKGTPEGIRIAMIAACASSRATNVRDAVRDTVGRLLSELGRDQTTTFRLIEECGLAPSLWSAVARVVGYTAPEGFNPSIEDLALRMLKMRCGGLIPGDDARLSPDALRILGDLAAGGRTREAFDALVRSFGESIVEAIPPSYRTLGAIGANDTLPVFDEWVTADMLSRLLAGTLHTVEARDALATRRHTLWFDRYGCRYEAIAAGSEVLERIEAYSAGKTSKTTVQELFDAYRTEWYTVDGGYRRFVSAVRSIPTGRFKRELDQLKTKVSDAYGKFLSDLGDRWQEHLMDEGSYPPPSIPSQASFFRIRVEDTFPAAREGKRVGVIVSDAMRYEVGVELASRINAGGLFSLRNGATATCDAMVCMLPSYTQLGMAALLPQGELEIDPGTENVLKDGKPTNGLSNRQKIAETAIPGTVAIQAAEVLESGLPKVDDAPLVVVYHNAIDKRGDSRDTEGEVFAACDEAIAQVARIADELLRAGCGKVLVTADHGFLYQDQPVEEFNYADVDGLNDLVSVEGKPFSYTRRFTLSWTLPNSDMLVEYSSADLSLKGNCKIGMPRGITRLRLRGSGARYVHGGASLQENVVPVVAIEPARRSRAATQTGVQGFLCGRPAITGSMVALDVYQTQPCSDKVSSLTVRVGLYDPADGKRLLCAAEQPLELASTAPASEDRKTRVELLVTDDVDSYDSALLRISSRIGSTNQFRSEWEQKLSVNRAFGNDFDF